MSHETYNPPFEYFSADELEMFLGKIAAFWHYREEIPSLAHAEVLENGSPLFVLDRAMPHYAEGARSVIVVAPHPNFMHTVTVADSLAAPDSDTFGVITRQMGIDPQRIADIDYQNTLMLHYSEMAADSNGKPLLPPRGIEPDGKAVMRYRPFTHADMQDMIEMLDKGRAAPKPVSETE